MPPIPTLASVSLGAKFLEAIGVAAAADLLKDSLQQREEAFWLDVGNGANPFQAIAFRLSNGVNDTSNFFSNLQLAEIPTIEEIQANPILHMQRLVLGTNVDVRPAMDDSDGGSQSDAVNESRMSGSRLLQAIANAANADKSVARSIEQYLNNANDVAKSSVEEFGARAEAEASDSLKPFIRGFVDFVVEALFTRRRKSGDAKRVSKEEHEYKHLISPISTYRRKDQGANTTGSMPSHVQFALDLIRDRMQRSVDGTANGLGPGQDFEEYMDMELEEILEDQPQIFRAETFTYGKFVDCPAFRKLLANLKKLVQASRSANVSGILALNDGDIAGDYIAQITSNWPAGNFLSQAASELLLVSFASVDDVGITVRTDEILQQSNETTS